MWDSAAAIRIGLDYALETSVVVLLADVLSALPAVEFSENAHVLGSWGPLHEGEVVVGLQSEAELLVRSGHVLDSSFCRLEDIKPSKFKNNKN